MKKPLRRYITDAVVLLSTLIFVIVSIAILIGVNKGVGIASDVNLSDVFSNILNIVSLYATVFVVINLTSEISDRGKTVDVEKSLVIDRLKSLHERIENFHIKIESGSIGFLETIQDLDRVDRVHNAIVNIINSNDSSIGLETPLTSSHCATFDQHLDYCRNILTYTPPRSTENLNQVSFVTISQDIITITPNGVQATTIQLEALKASVDSYLLSINRS